MAAFPIIPVTAAMVRQDEPMGSKDKFWCELPPEAGGGLWLFKEPRQEPGKMEHLAEKIAAEIAGVLALPVARVELAEFEGRRGTVAQKIEQPDEVLVHGNEVIAGRVRGYDPMRKRRTSDHTWERVLEAIRAVCGGHCEEDLRQLAGYLVFDALIGNTDRHHENWGLLRRSRGGPEHRLAPSFDHASSLGREMRDVRRERLLAESRLEERYLRRGPGGIYLAERGEAPVPPLVLVETVAPQLPRHFSPWLREVSRVTDDAIHAILQSTPDGWMTQPQAAFAASLVKVSREVLLRIPCP